jgi:hypothetical protein
MRFDLSVTTANKSHLCGQQSDFLGIKLFN